MPPRHNRSDPTPPLAQLPLSAYVGANDDYRTGTGDPAHGHDDGAGPWGSHKRTLEVIAKRQAILELIGTGATWVYPGRHATAHVAHYFGNTGSTYTIALENMIQFVSSAKANMEGEFRLAQAFLQTLPPGRHQFTSRRARGGYNMMGESSDWFFGIGGYTRWGKGEATISTGAIGRRYEVDFTYCFYDRYNWDGDKSVNFGSIEITDEFMGEFHLQGLAREFDCVGSVTRKLAWDGDFGAPDRTAILQRPGR